MAANNVEQQTCLSLLQLAARRPVLFFLCGWLVVSGYGCAQQSPPPEEKAVSPTSSSTAVPGAAMVETDDMRTQPLGAAGRWKNVPSFLDGAEIQVRPIDRKKGGADLACTVKTEGLVVVAAAPDALVGNPVPQQQGEISTEVSGWVAIGTIGKGETASPDDMTLFRREFKAGEKFDFTSPSWSMPYLVVLKEKNVAPVLVQKAVVVPLLKMSHLVPPATPLGLSAGSRGDVVMLNTHEVDPREAGPSILERELARQAFLLAAREELGLATRDKSLRETFPSEAEPVLVPFDILFSKQPGGPIIMVFRQNGKEYEVLWQKQLTVKAEDGFEDLVTRCEALSREDFLAILRSAGFEKIEQTRAAGEQPPADGDTRPADFNFTAQFAALRRLHSAVQVHGESPELTAALARKYADLGAETAFLWSPAHKVFEARGLLYAERLVQRSGGDPFALWNRAYVRALVGRHQAALDDLARADQAAGADAPARRPEWVPLVRAHCEFDAAALRAAETDENTSSLAAYLRMLGQEFGKSTRARLATIELVLTTSPDSFRAMDLVALHSPLGISRAARGQALRLFPASLRRRLADVPGLPPAAHELYASDGDDEGDDIQEEIQTRRKLIDLLNAAARAPTERSEPSLSVLGTLIQETGFVHGWRMVDFDRDWLAVPADDTIDEIWPLVETHPYAKYVDALRSDATASAAAIRELAATIDTSELELTEERMLTLLGKTRRSNFQEQFFYWLAFFRYDPIYRDLAVLVLVPESNYQLWHQEQLREFCPHAPLIVEALIVGSESAKKPELALEKAAGWEKKYIDDPSVLGALVDLYAQNARDDDALRVAKRAVEVSPDVEARVRLAHLYKKRGDLERWFATLNDVLKEDAFGLAHAQVQTEIAEHYMDLKDWDKALPYALQAAGSWSAYGLLAAHRCYNGMHDWQNAELFLARASTRYENIRYEWFFWCKRTGKGKVEAARSLAERYFDSQVDPPPQELIPFLATFKQLTGEQLAAMRIWAAGFEKSNDPYHGLSAALIAHDLGLSAERDKLLEDVTTRGKNDGAEGHTRFIRFAAMIRQQITKGKEVTFDEEEFDKICKTAPSGVPTKLQYFSGWFLLHEGHTDPARKHLMQAATAPHLWVARTLAAALLLEQNVVIEETREKE